MKLKKINNLIIGTAMAAVLTVGGVSGTFPFVNSDHSIIVSMESYAASGRLYYQYSSSWRTDLRNSGCGLFATANAIYALNGKRMDINSFASWAKNNGWSGNGGTTRDTLYSRITSKYGSSFGFKVTSMTYGTVDSTTLKNHLANGGVAVAHVGTPGENGHFIALSGYNKNNNQFLVIDSVNNRCAGSSGYSWMPSSVLKSSANKNRTRIDWFCLISPNNNIRYFPRYTGTSTSIVTALNAIGADSSYSYRKQIAAANSITNYCGSADQNTTMLTKLKAGNLVKPGSAPSLNYFKRYTGSSTSIVTALNAIGADSSYSYRKQIAAANSITNYCGSANQNTIMLNKLKAGNLIKP